MKIKEITISELPYKLFKTERKIFSDINMNEIINNTA